MKDITIEEAVKDLKSLIEEYKDCSVEGLNMQVDVGFDEERCRNLEKVLNELEKKDKIIDAMTEWIENEQHNKIDDDNFYTPSTFMLIKEEIKQYFEKEVKDE